MKINQLLNEALNLDGTELIPADQGGETKKLTTEAIKDYIAAMYGMDGNVDGFKLGSILAVYSTSSVPATTRVKIKLPWTTSSAIMVKFTIDVYSYYKKLKYEVSGYLFPTDNNWLLPKVICLSDSGVTGDVIFGRDTDGRAYASIPTAGHIGIVVRDAVFGNGSLPYAQRGWSIVEDETSPNAVTAEFANVIHTRNAINAVSQVGGVPTGGILFSGSNAQGRYDAYANGALVCQSNKAVAVSQFNWPFPAVMIDTNYSLSYTPGAASAGDYSTKSASIVTKTTTAVTINRSKNSVADVGGEIFDLVVIGRWY